RHGRDASSRATPLRGAARARDFPVRTRPTLTLTLRRGNGIQAVTPAPDLSTWLAARAESQRNERANSCKALAFAARAHRVGGASCMWGWRRQRWRWNGRQRWRERGRRESFDTRR